ncbi:D-alanyl-D-alanine carboxypeptidase family protein [Rhizobium sp. CECT 9324]|uniref:D-alanyl-D-alanine carboxypeptidase family protein n=1 Tax=Rhizobium sp. CECT 9324 TaxID=2845820 RepID=UPI001E5C5F47|nr:D-alanyl-D-alanine carboxypeptidase family protein [Rhizobium sp. CECT 9324]CAH0341110.1 D-alanyl-D-alanine carboxypeptidase DacA [Rhizobium sp. CECT 9324]
MTYRNASLFLSSVMALVAAFGPTQAFAGRAHVILDANTGQVLEAENADVINYPASLTKMMTLYLTFEALHQKRFGWDDRLVMSENAESKEPYKFAVGAGNKITVREAVMGMIVLSTNDAAVAVAETLAGSEQAFGHMMTAKARKLGMTSTVFTNPAGLPDPNQVTTAADMARLGLALMRDYPEEYKLFSTTRLTFRSMKFRGHNNLLSTYPGADGIKTGYTKASGYNLVSSASNGTRRVVGVVLGGDSAAERDGQMAALFDKYLGAQSGQ